jgi:cytoskeletal protein CcmA (bactofilin family)
MSDPSPGRPRRRLFDQPTGAPTLVGSGARFEGRLEVDGPMSLAGTVVGDGDISGILSIAREAHWHGNVSAQAAVVAGRVTGDLTIETKLEIGKSAVIRGAIRAGVIAIADGAVVDGQMTVTSAQPIVRFEERRAPASEPGGER